MSQPLSIALPTASVKTAMPEIPDKTWVKVKLAEVKEQDMIPDGQEVAADGKKPLIQFRLELVEPTNSTEGKTIEPGKPGSVLIERVYFRDKNNTTSIPERATQQVGKIMDAFDNTGDADNKKNLPPRANFDGQWVAESIGKVAWAFVIIDGQYGNKVKELASTQDPKFAVAPTA